MTGVTRRRAFMFRRGLYALATGAVGLAAMITVLAVDHAAAPARATVIALLLALVSAFAMDRWLRPRGPGAVPVLTYHSVAPPSLRERWERIGWGNLTVSPEKSLFNNSLPSRLVVSVPPRAYLQVIR